MKRALICTALVVVSGSLWAQSRLPASRPQPSPILAPSNAAPAAAPKPDEADAQLPVRRVVLFKNGVGYFEHSATVRDNENVGIDFTTSQLNDVLKSLAVVDMGAGRITSVRYNSVEPLEERLGRLRLGLGPQATRADLLNALRGTRVEVRAAGGTFVGKLLSVERNRKVLPNGESIETTEFAVVSDSEEMRSFELGPAVSVRAVESGAGNDLRRYLSLVSSGRGRDLRRMTIAATGTGTRQLRVSYISEVPVWKSTYRILLPARPGGRTMLQGWAIVDNTVGEDWNDVELSLVAGAPQSFIQDLSQAYYVRRPVVAPPKAVELTPQTHEATLLASPAASPTASLATMTSLSGTVFDQQGAVIAGAQVTIRNEETGVSQATKSNAQGEYRFETVPAGNSALIVESTGFRRFMLTNIYLGVGRNNNIKATLSVAAGTETVEVNASAPLIESSSANAISAFHAEAEGRQAGDFFRYDLKPRIRIGRNESALVPIAQGEIEAMPVTLWNSEPGVPLRALWVRNTTALTLDGGTFEILENDTFAGEGTMETIHPKERRLLSYAQDNSIGVAVEKAEGPYPVRRVKVIQGVLIYTQEERETTRYRVRNEDAAERSVVIEHPARENWQLAGDAKPEETSASFHRFLLKAAPGKTAELTVAEFHPEDTKIEVSDLTDDNITQLAEIHALSPALEESLRKVLAQKSALAAMDQQIKRQQQEIAAIAEDQSRVRENMKALKGSAEERSLLQRYTAQFNAQEDQISALRKALAALNDEREKAQAELDRMVMAMTFDEKY